MNRAERRRQQKRAEKEARKAQRSLGASTINVGRDLEQAVRHHTAGELNQAERLYKKVLQADPNQPDAMHLQGVIAHQRGRNDEAVDLISKSLAIQPGNVDALNNLGLAFAELGQLKDAVENYRKAIAAKPDFAEAHNNLGNVLADQGCLEEAKKSLETALAHNPTYIEAHYNLAKTLQDLGILEEAVVSYLKAIEINPNHVEAWNDCRYCLKALHFSQSGVGRALDICEKNLSPAVRDRPEYALLNYYLESFRTNNVENSFSNALATLSSSYNEEIDAGIPKIGSTDVPDKLVALVHFGRSGTGLLHSLIDGHPEISTLPSVYLRGFFNAGVWKHLTIDGWRTMPQRFVQLFDVLFDAHSPNPVPSKLGEQMPFLGREEGMTVVGENHDESLCLDKKKFISEAVKLLQGLETVNPRTFLMVVHAAFEKVLGTKTLKETVFYHIHNPDDFATVNFLRHAPDARLVMMVREPKQNIDSWLREPIDENNYTKIVLRLINLLFTFDQIIFRTQDSVGVRLEDLKTKPEATMRALCKWMGVKESPTLYEMTAQGKKWWGDPSSPNYQKGEQMSPFGDSPIKHSEGNVFSENDKFILGTLFYPFSVRFKYVEPDPNGFRMNLKKIRPQLDDLLDFEKALAENSGIGNEEFKSKADYLLLHASLVDRWEVLEELDDYPNMITPLEVTSE
jgi:tetratricopeptide (TPR) repeat protein